MGEGFVTIRPDKEKSRSILKMSNATLEMIKSIDSKKFPSIVIKEYYEVIRGFINAILLVDGFKSCLFC